LVSTEPDVGKTELHRSPKPSFLNNGHDGFFSRVRSLLYTICSLLSLLAISVSTILPASAEIKLQQINQSIVSVRSYSGDKEVGAGIGFIIDSDKYNGFVVTSAQVLVRGETITVSIPGSGAQLVARNLLSDNSLGLAVLKINGLQAPALIFAQQSVEEGDTVWSAGIRADRGRTVWLSKGSISRRYIATGPSSRVNMLMHNASLGESGFGSPLLNECGQIVGFSVSSPGDTAGVAYAIQGGSLSSILTAQHLNIKTAAGACLSAIAQARQSAESATARAKEAKDEAAKAISQANELGRRLTDVNQRNDSLQKQTREAQKRANKAIADAAEAARQAQSAREEVTRRTREIMTETQAIFKTMKADSLKREQQLHEALDEQRNKAEIWERMLLGGLLLLFVMLISAFFYLRRGDHPQKVQTVEPGSPKTELQKVNLSEYVLDGEDREGVRYLLRIAADQLMSEKGVVIGRNPPDSPYVINHSDVSRQHIKLKLVKDRLFIEDMNTTNGTTVNGQSIDQKGAVTMNNGDQIILGSVVLRLRTMG